MKNLESFKDFTSDGLKPFNLKKQEKERIQKNLRRNMRIDE